MQSSSPNAQAGEAIPSLSLVKKKFLGKYAISAEEFTDEMVLLQIYALGDVRMNQETNCRSIGFPLFWPCANFRMLTFLLSGWSKVPQHSIPERKSTFMGWCPNISCNTIWDL